jgi:flagellin
MEMVGRIGSSDYVNNSLLSRLSQIAKDNDLFKQSENPAAIGISEIMKSQYKGMQQAINNVQDAYSMLNVASGAISDIQDTMNQMRELSVQASNGIYTDEDKKYIQQEYNQLGQHLQDVYNNTQYNGKALFQNDQLTLQGGPNAGDTQTIYIPNLSEQINQLSKINVVNNAEESLKIIDNVQPSIQSAQSSIGSVQNSLNENANNLMVGYENMVASQSQIMDADEAEKVISQTTNQIQTQASIYSLIDFKNTTLAYMESLLSG